MARRRIYKNVTVYTRCNEYNGVFRVDDKVLFCNYCNVSVEWKHKSVIDSHYGS